MSVQTVLGEVKAEELGHTLPHEHMILDFVKFYQIPPIHLKQTLDEKLSLKNLGFVRQYPYSSKDNIQFQGDDTKAAILNDVKYFKKLGGGTIVENTPYNLGPNVEFLKEVAKATGVKVIAGTGFYIAGVQDPDTLTMSTEEIYNHMKKEIIEGFDSDKNVKAGFMGEIGSVWPIHDFEKRVIRAVGELQEQVGCAVSFHPHRVEEAPAEIMRLYMEAGGRANKAIMSHLDRTIYNNETLQEFSSLGSYCQWDLFGVEVSHYQLNSSRDMPSDGQRIEKIKLLLDEGKSDRITISHDIHTKHRLIDFGGHGYSHIMNNVIPKMKERGISEEDIHQITVKNPAEWLQYNHKH